MSTMRLSFWHTARRVFAVVLSLFMLLPVVVILIASLTNDNAVKFPPESFGVRWYVEVFKNESFREGIVFSLEVAFFVALASGIIGVLALEAVLY